MRLHWNEPKSVPSIVTVVPPDVGCEPRDTEVMVGTSKEKTASATATCWPLQSSTAIMSPSAACAVTEKSQSRHEAERCVCSDREKLTQS